MIRILITAAAVVFFSGSSGFANEPMGTFRNTWYYLVLETDYAGLPLDSWLMDMQGNKLVRVSSKFKARLRIEGSGKLQDGRVINYAGKVGGDIRYKWVTHPFGIGVKDCPLQPLRTVAVDPRRIPLGSLVRIEETVGMRFPDGTVHDGLWWAEDVGSAIQGDRIDLFVGAGIATGKFIESEGITYLKPLTVTLVARPDPASCVFQ